MCRMPCASCVARYARTHGPFSAADLHARYGSTSSAVLRELERDGESCRASCARGAAAAMVSTSRSCGGCAAHRWRHCARRSSRPRRAAWPLPALLARVDRHTSAGAGIDRLREVLVPLQGLALPVESWERDVLPRRTGAYSQTWLDHLCASGELVWVGAGPLGRLGAGGPLLPRRRPRDRPAPGPAAQASRPPRAPSTELLRERLAQGPCFFTDLLAEIERPAGGAPRGAMGPRLGRRGDQRRLGSPACSASLPGRARAARRRRSPKAGARPPPGGARASPPGAARGAQSQVQGRWSDSAASSAPAPSGCRRRAAAGACRAAARALRHRHPRAGPGRGDQGGVLDPLRHLLQARDARDLPPGLFHRGDGRRPVRAPRRGRAPACGTAAGAARGAPHDVLPPPTPPSPTGRPCPGPNARARTGGPPGSRAPTWCWSRSVPVLYVERGGRGLTTLLERPDGEARVAAAGRGGPASRGTRCAGRGGARRAGRQAGPRADRRPAGDLLALCGVADRARLPLRARGASP